MAGSVDGTYRDTYDDPWSEQRKKNTQKTSNQNLTNMVFTDKAEQSLTSEDFLNLMVMQMKNQDPMNPMDDSQMLAQMAQFSTMQQMQELASYSKQNYIASLVGQRVTAAKFAVNGTVQKETGVVEKISLVDNEYKIYVNGVAFSLEQIMELNSGTNTDLDFDASSLSITQQTISSSWVELKWPAATDDEELQENLSYSVYYVENKDDVAMTTVEEIEKNGTLAVKSNGMASTIVTGLDPEKSYQINIVVEDKSGNKSCYKPITIKTEAKKVLD